MLIDYMEGKHCHDQEQYDDGQNATNEDGHGVSLESRPLVE